MLYIYIYVCVYIICICMYSKYAYIGSIVGVRNTVLYVSGVDLHKGHTGSRSDHA